MTTDPLIHTLAVGDLLARFFQSFDDKNWAMMRDCLCDEVDTDYSSFRRVPASTISGDEYVDQRRRALQALEMQHNMLNLRVEVDAGAEHAFARCNYIIHRFHPSFGGRNDHYLHSYGHYVFVCANAGAWRISRIAQHLLRNHGNRDVHRAHIRS